MKTKEDLTKILNRIDGKGYKAYKDIAGIYQFDKYQLAIDYVQGDPFASPSRIRVIMNHKVSKIPKCLFDKPNKKISVEDFITRTFSRQIRNADISKKGSGKSGLIIIDRCGQEILQRTSVVIKDKTIEARLEIGLPARGRRVLGKQAIGLLCDEIREITLKSMIYDNINKNKLKEQVELTEDQNFIRNQLEKLRLLAFVANNSILPRESGISQKPLRSDVIPFTSPKSLEVTMELPNKGSITGMGIPEGVTLIVGGGYHGKSTLLKAIELGVYNHIPNDGREYVITRDDAVKIRAEDGRRVEKVNISPFINNLPNNKDTSTFSTENASGSTSQATNIIEAMEIGTSLLMIDEDTSATNFMIRDNKMKQLIAKEKEPITPFIDTVRSLYEDNGVSSIIVIGGSGEYFNVADKVIMMDEYKPIDVTNNAKNLADKTKHTYKFSLSTDRKISSKTFEKDHYKLKIKSVGNEKLLYDKSEIELKYVEQLIDESQTRCIGMIMRYIKEQRLYQNRSLKETIEQILDTIDNKGLDVISIYKGHPGKLALPRKQEISAALNRFRRLVVK
ncbi:MAG: ABC-ATPase domain-containing protein [Eubacteriales bacterium]